MPTWHGRPNAWCPRCGSLERHRVLWLYLTRETTICQQPLRVLHVAPERGIERQLRRQPDLDYVTTDLFDPTVTVRADLTDLPFDTASFDLVLCNHVLEHVDDDRAAMAEIHRVLTDSGEAIMQHPISPQLACTVEDPTVTSPEERERLYFQADHVRLYGLDFPVRLGEAGFNDVERIRYQDRLAESEIRRFRLEQLPAKDGTPMLELDSIYRAAS